MARRPRPEPLPDLAQKELEVLAELVAFAGADYHQREAEGGWARPMDVGGRNGSHHSRTLAKFVRLGLAEKRERGAWGRRGSWRYRVTDRGRAASLVLWKGYG